MRRATYCVAMLLPLAHATHWYFIPLYAAPVLIVLYSAIRAAIDRRRRTREDADRR